jgi:hypothetical protein
MKRLPLMLLALAVAGFLLGLALLFHLRFEAGDVYPPYSSLRADPLGARALYESLGRLLPTRRNYEALAKLGEGRATTLLLLGADPDDFALPPDEWQTLEAFAVGGGRLVIAFFPVYHRSGAGGFTAPAATNVPPAGRSPRKKAGRPVNDPMDAGPAGLRRLPMRERWKVDFDFDALARQDASAYQPARALRQVGNALPPELDCHTGLCFKPLQEAWRAIYARTNGQPVMLERRLGSGSVVMCADSFYFSNEALRREREPGLLAWFVGGSRRVVFDETHLGVEESPGLAALARKYRLQGLAASLVVLAALFVWKNAVSFLPPPAEAVSREPTDLVTGREAAAGFINLLRRNLRPADLLGVCLEEWRKSCAHQVSRPKLEQIQALIDAENARAPGERDAVEVYRRVSRMLARGGGGA